MCFYTLNTLFRSDKKQSEMNYRKWGKPAVFIPEPVSPSSPSVSGDELGVCWDCGGRGGMGGSGWVFPHRQLSYLASLGVGNGGGGEREWDDRTSKTNRAEV